MVLEAVASVLEQSFPIAGIVVVDDGSTDDTAAALETRFGSAIRVVRTENQGVAAARNAGVAASDSDWIAFLDSDDLWLPRKLRAQADYIRHHPGTRICHTNEIWERDGVRINQSKHHRKPDGDAFMACLRGTVVGPSTVVMRRDLFVSAGGFDHGLSVCEDYDLWLRLARTEAFGLVDQPLVIKRGGHADQLSRQLWGMDRFRIAALARLLAGDLSTTQRQATIDVLRHKCAILEQGAQRRGRTDEAAAYAAIADWTRSKSEG